MSAWKIGDYSCCRGSPTCANNRLKRQIDEFMRKAKRHPDAARNTLYTWISDLEEDVAMQKLLRRQRSPTGRTA